MRPNAQVMGRQRYFLKHNLIFLEPGDVIQTSAFGVRIHPVTGERKVHNGLDCCLWTGECMEATILAIARGRVVHCETDVLGFDKERAAGNNISIDHGNGYVSRYFHFEPNTIRVSLGDELEAGAPLGYMGKTGMSTGEHLHFQLEYKGKPVDPRGLLLTGSFCKLKWWLAIAALKLRIFFNG